MNKTYAQELPEVSYITSDQGLSNNFVSCIYQDHTGMMWFGTFDGLNRYDGYTIKVFRFRFNNSASLISNRISCIAEDGLKNLWIGTRSGISIYDNVIGSFQSVHYQTNTGKKELLQASIEDIKTDNQGNILIATASKGLFFCKAGSVQPKEVPLYPSQGTPKNGNYYATAIAFDNQKGAWVMVKEVGLCLYNYLDNTLTVANESIKNGTALKVDVYNNLWVGSENGLYRYSYVSNIITPVISHCKRVMQISTDEKNELWVATDGDGVYKVNPLTNLTLPYPARNSDLFKSEAIYNVFHDRQQRIWVGSLRGGITLIDPYKNRFRALVHNPINKNSLVNNFTLSTTEDANQNLWIGTDGGGVSYWNRKQNKFTNYTHNADNLSSISNNFVTNILKDADNEIWMATWGGGINRFNPQKKTFECFEFNNTFSKQTDRYAWGLYQDKHMNIWAGTCSEGGLYRRKKGEKIFSLFDPALKNMLSFYEDNTGQLWGGNYTSLIKIDTLNKKHSIYKTGFAVKYVCEDKKGRFWVCTDGGGLLLFNKKSEKYKRYTEDEGLASNAVFKLMEDKKGNLWLSTFNGISIFNPDSGSITNISQNDGLLSNQLGYNASLALSSGEFVFGTIKGLNILTPDFIQPKPKYYHTLQLTNLSVNNVPLEQNSSYIKVRSHDNIQTIKLPFNKAALSLNFVAPEYSAPDKINYSYYLEGWDKGWSNPGKNRYVNYSRLMEGHYTFKVKSSDAYGNWGEEVSLLTVIILPPWYRTLLAYALYVAVFFSLLHIYFYYRSKQLKLSYEVEYAKMENEKEKELNEKRISFFTNISHEFRTPLTLIINPVKELLGESKENENKTELKFIYRNAKRLLSLVDQLLFFRKVESDSGKLDKSLINIHELCKEVFSCFEQQAKSRKINYQFSEGKKDIFIYADWGKLEIVLFNLISNAFKFTPDSGFISLLLEDMPNDICIKVKDSGHGISKDVGNKLFEKFYQSKSKQSNANIGFGIGLYLAKEIVTAHEGTIIYESELEKGTEFSVHLHKGPLQFNDQAPVENLHQKSAIIKELAEELNTESNFTKGVDINKNLNNSNILNSKKTVLIVDDNDEIRQYLTKILEVDFVVQEASNGELAWKMLKQFIPDIIISDIVMEEMSGIELCTKIKADSSIQHIPVILLTATSSQQIQLSGLNCGAEDYINKPFDKDLLIARVNSILKNRNIINQYFLDTITLRRPTSKISEEHKNFLERCIVIIENNLDQDEFCIKKLAEVAGLSHSGLYKKIKATSGLSPNAFIRFIRLRQAAIILLSTNVNINEAAFQVGISDVKYFREQFKKVYGVNPSDYIKLHKNKFNKDFSVIIQ